MEEGKMDQQSSISQKHSTDWEKTRQYT